MPSHRAQILIAEYHWLFTEEVAQSAPPSPLVFEGTDSPLAASQQEQMLEEAVEVLASRS
jgi:hypothetical protein